MKKFCAFPGCPALVEIGTGGYCPLHQRDAPTAEKVPDPFYLSTRWRKFRNSFIARHPLCVMCGRPAKIVDHIREIKDGGAKFDPSNCQALCIACHNTKTSDERRKRGQRKGRVVYGY